MSELSEVTTREVKAKYKIMWILRFLSVVFLTLLIMFGPPGAVRFWIASVVFVILVHIGIIWNFIQFCRDKEDMHPLVKAYIIGFFLFLGTVGLFASHKAEEMSKWVTGAMSYSDRVQSAVGKTEGDGKVTQKAPRKPRDVETIQLRVVPGARFKTAYIPPGSAAASWECPDGCFIEIEHDGDPLCQNGMYSGVQCWVETLSSSGKKRQVEQFEIQPGIDVDFPQKLGNPISRFGTSREIGPVDVVVNIVHNR